MICAARSIVVSTQWRHNHRHGATRDPEDPLHLLIGSSGDIQKIRREILPLRAERWIVGNGDAPGHADLRRRIVEPEHSSGLDLFRAPCFPDHFGRKKFSCPAGNTDLRSLIVELYFSSHRNSFVWTKFSLLGHDAFPRFSLFGHGRFSLLAPREPSSDCDACTVVYEASFTDDLR